MTVPHVRRVSGPVVEVDDLDAGMLELVEVGEARLPGEVIALDGKAATLQVYAYTGGLRPGDPVVGTGHPLRAELGPGLLGGVFDGLLRRLSGAGETLRDGGIGATLERDRRWRFTPRMSAGEAVEEGAILGEVPETAAVAFRLTVPVGVRGTVSGSPAPPR